MLYATCSLEFTLELHTKNFLVFDMIVNVYYKYVSHVNMLFAVFTDSATTSVFSFHVNVSRETFFSIIFYKTVCTAS